MEVNFSKKEKTYTRIALFIGVALIGYVIFNWSEIPDQIPIYFGFSGKPQSWGPKEFALLLPLLNLAILGMGIGIRKTPSLLNIPFKLEGEAKEKAIAYSFEMLALVNVKIGVLFSYLTYIMIMPNTVPLGPMFVPSIVLVFFLVVGYYLMKIKNLKSPNILS